LDRQHLLQSSEFYKTQVQSHEFLAIFRAFARPEDSKYSLPRFAIHLQVSSIKEKTHVEVVTEKEARLLKKRE